MSEAGAIVPPRAGVIHPNTAIMPQMTRLREPTQVISGTLQIR